MFEIIRSGTQIDFVRSRHLWAGISLVAVIASIVLFFTKGLNYGVDFSGGAEIQIQVPASWDIAQVRKTVDEGGVKDARIQQIGEPGAGQYLIKTTGDEKTLNQVSGQIEAALGKVLKANEFDLQRADVVGPAAGKSLRRSGFLAMFYALLGILIYVGIRFDFRYAPGAVIALFHDAIVTVGVFIVLNKQFDLQVLAAILALVGYSINDTIVIFDRIREISQQHPEFSIEQSVNRAMNETLGRTILTSFATFLTCASLFFFGGKVIHDFSFALMIGIIVGSYSTIFVASSLVITLTRYQKKRGAKSKSQGSSKGAKQKKVTVRPEPKYQS